MILDSGLLFWATLYMYCQHSYVSRKIHTRQCYCIIFTTSCFQCHSALPLLCVRRPAQSSLLQWFTRKWVPHQISSSGQPRPWSSPGWRLMSHQSWTWIGWIHGGFSYSAVEHRMYAVTKMDLRTCEVNKCVQLKTLILEAWFSAPNVALLSKNTVNSSHAQLDTGKFRKSDGDNILIHNYPTQNLTLTVKTQPYYAWHFGHHWKTTNWPIPSTISKEREAGGAVLRILTASPFRPQKFVFQQVSFSSTKRGKNHCIALKHCIPSKSLLEISGSATG